jgi:hypothetical protein
MLPGYERPPVVVPYLSPIQIIAVTPKKTGNRILRVEFWNVGYAVGVQDFAVDLRLVKHTDDYLIADFDLHGREASDRSAVINTISFPWLERFFPELETPRSQTSGGERDAVSRFLNERFADE